jgi:FkbM family methyltransferase
MEIYQEHLATWPRTRLEDAIRRRVQTAYLGDGLVLARILGRQKILLSSSDRGFACHLMLDGFWEMWLTQFLARRVTRGMTVVDVGANFGYYTLMLADAVGETGHVIAAEPNPQAALLLRQSVLLNGYASRTSIVTDALSNAAGHALLFVPANEPKNATVVEQPSALDGQTIEVATVTLDEVALRYPKVDLIKIDAEGSEVAIVAGMQQVIARDHPMVVLEYNARRYRDPQGFLASLLAHYREFREITFNGDLQTVDTKVVACQDSVEDRLLFFK